MGLFYGSITGGPIRKEFEKDSVLLNGKNLPQIIIILNSLKGKLAFAAFLQDEFAIENLNFLIEAHKFSSLTKFQELKVVAEQLICRFVGANSETPVNLSAAIEGQIFGTIEKGEFSNTLFLEAENSVRDTLRFGAYARFLRSDLYREIEGLL